MGKKYGYFHRSVDGVETVLYGTATAAFSGIVILTVAGGFALGATGIGMVAVLVALPVAAVPYAGAVYTGSKTIHKAHHVAGIEHEDHSLRNAEKALDVFKLW